MTRRRSSIRKPLIRGLQGLCRARRGGAVTVGNFDGVHVGHRAMVERAAANGRPCTVVTFEPHPLEFFRGDDAPARITGLREKLHRFAATDADQIVCLPFNQRLASMTPERFVDTLLVEGLAAEYVLVGDDFRFGRQRRGDHELLRRLGEARGFRVERMETVKDQGGRRRVSSTRIRQLLAQGEFDAAAELLGERYCVGGRVVRGDAIGRTLGWPTVNVKLPPRPPPLAGVYAAWVHGVTEKPWPAALSVGVRPVVEGRRTVFEAHLIDFEGDLYGRHVRVEPVAWLRGEEDFPGLAALAEQIGRDVDEARRQLQGRNT